MKRRVMSAIMAIVILSLPLLFAVPTAFAQSGGRGGGIGHSGRGGGFGGSRSGEFVGGATRGGVAGGTHRHGFTSGPTHSFGQRSFIGHGRHHHFGYNHSFIFGFGVGVFPPTGWRYDPYYYWGLPAYPYYSDYGYYGTPYWLDPCLTSDPAYAPYCPPVSDPYQGGYDVPPVDYPAPEPRAQPDGGGEVGSTPP